MKTAILYCTVKNRISRSREKKVGRKYKGGEEGGHQRTSMDGNKIIETEKWLLKQGGQALHMDVTPLPGFSSLSISALRMD